MKGNHQRRIFGSAQLVSELGSICCDELNHFAPGEALFKDTNNTGQINQQKCFPRGQDDRRRQG